MFLKEADSEPHLISTGLAFLGVGPGISPFLKQVTTLSQSENHKTRFFSGAHVLSALFCQHLVQNLKQPNPQHISALNLNLQNPTFYYEKIQNTSKSEEKV